jgi:hypothetical protein
MASLDHPRFRPTVVRLGNGSVLAAAGKIANVGPVGVTEIYDPAADDWSEGPEIGAPRTGAAGVTLPSGNALVLGGYDQTTGDFLDELLIFDATSRTWNALPPMNEQRVVPTATLLVDGRVLIVGGLGAGDRCEIAE